MKCIRKKDPAWVVSSFRYSSFKNHFTYSCHRTLWMLLEKLQPPAYNAPFSLRQSAWHLIYTVSLVQD